MALLDLFDRRALALGALPVGVFCVLVVRCLLPPSVGAAAAVPFAGVMLLSYAPLTYLGVFRAWGDLWTGGTEVADPKTRPSWGRSLGSSWREVSYSGLHVFSTLWIARMHWGLVDQAKETLRVPRAHDLTALLRHVDPPPTGLDLFGESLTVMGIIVPLTLLGLTWLILPSRP